MEYLILKGEQTDGEVLLARRRPSECGLFAPAVRASLAVRRRPGMRSVRWIEGGWLRESVGDEEESATRGGGGEDGRVGVARTEGGTASASTRNGEVNGAGEGSTA